MTTNYVSITLKNGIEVANFNSPHNWAFDDGSILPAQSDERATETMLGSKDEEELVGFGYGLPKYTRITKKFVMSDRCHDELIEADHTWSAHIILVPLPVLMLIKEKNLFPKGHRFHTCFVVDRIKKINSSTKFCQ